MRVVSVAVAAETFWLKASAVTPSPNLFLKSETNKKKPRRPTFRCVVNVSRRYESRYCRTAPAPLAALSSAVDQVAPAWCLRPVAFSKNRSRRQQKLKKNKKIKNYSQTPFLKPSDCHRSVFPTGNVNCVYIKTPAASAVDRRHIFFYFGTRGR